MDLDRIPLLSMIKGKLGYLSDRQKLIAQNVANADTPGYHPQDLRPFAIKGRVPMAPAGAGGGALPMIGPASGSAVVPGPAEFNVTAVRTNPSHIATPARASTAWKAQEAPDSEARLDGNQVVLEDQMIKMSEARLDHDAAIGLYQKSLAMLRLAARRPGA